MVASIHEKGVMGNWEWDALQTRQRLNLREGENSNTADVNYYDVGGVSSIDVIKSKLSSDEFQGFLLGNVMKYVLRCKFKGSMSSDIKKAKVYLGYLEDTMPKKESK